MIITDYLIVRGEIYLGLICDCVKKRGGRICSKGKSVDDEVVEWIWVVIYGWLCVLACTSMATQCI